jgi:hypothetical protein
LNSTKPQATQKVNNRKLPYKRPRTGNNLPGVVFYRNGTPVPVQIANCRAPINGLNLTFGVIIANGSKKKEMKKISLVLVSMMLLVGLTSKAQTYKKIFYRDQVIENNDVKIMVIDAVATPAGVKFKIRIYNKTNDYIVYKPSESIFKIAGKSFNPNEKWLIIRPNDDDYQVIDLFGAGYMFPENFNFVMEGMYKFSTDVKGVNANDFKLPAAKNDFKAGGFNIVLLKNKKTTARTDATFSVQYVGDKIGVFEPNKVSMKMADGKEYANYHSNKKPLIYAKGEDKDIVVAWKDIPVTSGDMQKDEMTIMWQDAFKEITPDKMLPLTITVIFDEETTKLKNK